TKLPGVSDDACFTPDGKSVVYSRFTFDPLGDEISSCDLATGKTERLWMDHKYRGSAHQLVFSPDGASLAVYYPARQNGNDFDLVYLFDMNAKKEYRLFERESWSSGLMAFSPDSKQLFIYRYPHLQVWNVADRKKESQIKLGSNATSLAVSPDGTMVAVQ